MRVGQVTWGPNSRVIYSPRWPADHHPWLVEGTDDIRYANYEVTEEES